MKTLFLLLFLSSTIVFAQKKTHPSQKVSAQLDKLIESARITDSIVQDSKSKFYEETHIASRIQEGSLRNFDSINGKVQEIGSGGFSRYTYTNKETNRVIKSRHNTTLHYKYDTKDSINANTERREINIYYIKDKPYFAIYNEYHYNRTEVISSNRYYVQLDIKRRDVYDTKDFQEEIRNYIIKLSEEVLAEK